MAFLSPADLKDGKAEAPRDQRGCLCHICIRKRGYTREEPQLRSLLPDYRPGSISSNAV